MPDGYQVSEPAFVVYPCYEDDLADAIKVRPLAAGVLCDRVAYFVDDGVADRTVYKVKRLFGIMS